MEKKGFGKKLRRLVVKSKDTRTTRLITQLVVEENGHMGRYHIRYGHFLCRDT